MMLKVIGGTQVKQSAADYNRRRQKLVEKIQYDVTQASDQKRSSFLSLVEQQGEDGFNIAALYGPVFQICAADFTKPQSCAQSVHLMLGLVEREAKGSDTFIAPLQSVAKHEPAEVLNMLPSRSKLALRRFKESVRPTTSPKKNGQLLRLVKT